MTKSFNDKLIELLKKDLRFVDEDSGELIRSEIINEALKVDKKLIETLLGEKEIKEKFFTEIKGHWIFELNKFIDFIQDKNFLSDSYTKFKNKIGLNIDGKFLNERKEVTLVWPFKDCVLEGGMTKEDEKRNEIFFNETLAQDEIDRLLDPKVLTNFKRYTAKGEEKVKDFKRDENGVIKENLIIKGNNLLALHSLKKEFQGRVKLIYIDVPFNTGGDSFNYNDKFNHSSWLTFMKNRLEISKTLLADDGSIFIHCDENESHYLKVLCDEIFNRENLMNEIIWRYRTYQGQVKDYFPKKHDTIFWYIKNNRPNFELSYQENKEDTVDFKRWAEFINEEGQIIFPKYPKTDSRFTAYLNKWIKENGEPKNGDIIYNIKGYVVDDVWEDIKALDAKNKSERTGFKGGQKPEELVYRIIHSVTEEGDLVLDYNLGSGTTTAVAHKMKRRYIGIEQLDYGKNDSTYRMLKVIGKEKTKGKVEPVIEDYDLGGISPKVNWKGGGDFIYCELMKFNEEAIDKIQDAKNTDSLLKIWKDMCEHYFLNYDVDIKKFNENHDEFKKLSLDKQKKLLVEMLNKNQLYVNLSEIDDAQFKVSKEDKELNKKFYK